MESAIESKLREISASCSLEELYKHKYLEALRNIATLEDRLKRYTDQSWELETLRQQVDAQERFDGWK